MKAIAAVAVLLALVTGDALAGSCRISCKATSNQTDTFVPDPVCRPAKSAAACRAAAKERSGNGVVCTGIYSGNSSCQEASNSSNLMVASARSSSAPNHRLYR